MPAQQTNARIFRQRCLTSTAILCLTLSIFLLLYNIPLDSDRLYFDDLVGDLFQGGQFKDWKLAVAPGYIPDLLLYWIAYFIFSTPALRLLFVSGMQALLCLLAALYLAKELKPDLSKAASVAITVALAIATSSSTITGAWLFLNSNNAHVSSTLFALLSSATLLSYLRKCQAGKLVLLMVWGMLATPSSATYVLVFALPVLALLISAMWKAPSLRWKIKSLILSILAGQIGAFCIRKILTFHDAILDRVPMKLGAMAVSARSVWSNTLALGNQPLCGYLTTGLILTCLIIAFRYPPYIANPVALTSELLPAVDSSRARREARLQILATWLVRFCLLLTVAGAVISGGFADPYAFRYLAFPIALAVVLAAVRIDQTAFKDHGDRMAKFSWLLCALCLVLQTDIYNRLQTRFPNATPGYLAIYGYGRFGEEKVARCIASAKGSGTQIKDGISQYWLARAVHHFSPDHAMLAVYNDLNPFFWMSSAGPIIRPKRYERFYNFAVVQTGGETIPFEFTVANLRSRLPPPTRIIECVDFPAEVWVYGNGSLNAMVQASALKFIQAGN